MPRKASGRTRAIGMLAGGGGSARLGSIEIKNAPNNHGYVYILPGDLLAVISTTLEGKNFGAAADLELAPGKEVAGPPDVVGYWCGAPLAYEFLTKSSSQPERKTSAISEPNTTAFVRPFQLRHLYSCNHHLRVFQGYLGWLLTNPQFVKEHDELLVQHIAAVRRWGVHRDRANATPPMASRFFGNSHAYPASDPAWNEFASAKEEFCFRWRLAGLAGPDLPLPIGSGADQEIPITYFVRGIEQTGLYLLPDILPIPSRDQMRKSIDDARRSTNGSEHIADWIRIIRLGNQGKNQIDRFARIFVLQHYWRILKSCYAEATRSRTGKLELAFARWLDISEESVHRDRLIISRRLGRDWSARKHPS